jgi:hypothetical protein
MTKFAFPRLLIGGNVYRSTLFVIFHFIEPQKNRPNNGNTEKYKHWNIIVTEKFVEA